MMRLVAYILMITLLYSCANPKSEQESNKRFDVVKIHTTLGEIYFVLNDETPDHKASFIKLVNEGYFDEYTFNRVINNFVAQAGCPDTAEGFSDSPYLLKPEFNETLQHAYGAVGAGRDDNPEMLSAGCQFYIVQNKEGLHRLDNKYTVFGHVVKGMDVVDKIVIVSTDSADQPLESIDLKMELVRLDRLEISSL